MRLREFPFILSLKRERESLAYIIMEPRSCVAVLWLVNEIGEQKFQRNQKDERVHVVCGRQRIFFFFKSTILVQKERKHCILCVGICISREIIIFAFFFTRAELTVSFSRGCVNRIHCPFFLFSAPQFIIQKSPKIRKRRSRMYICIRRI